jgi:hypothetical protein
MPLPGSFTPPPGQVYDAAPTTFAYPPSLPGLATTPPTVSTPAFPATGSAVTNTTTVNVLAWLSAGTFTATVLNGATVSTSNDVNPVIIPAGQTIQFAYTGSPSWVWTAF